MGGGGDDSPAPALMHSLRVLEGWTRRWWRVVLGYHGNASSANKSPGSGERLCR